MAAFYVSETRFLIKKNKKIKKSGTDAQPALFLSLCGLQCHRFHISHSNYVK